MSKVSLSLIGLKSKVTRSEVTAALANLYEKPASYFTPHCDYLFEIQAPYVHLNKVSVAEAEKHQTRLESIGIKTKIGEVIVKRGLALVPIEEKESPAPECPACNQATTDPEICSECGVIVEKFLEQQAFDKKFQTRIAKTL